MRRRREEDRHSQDSISVTIRGYVTGVTGRETRREQGQTGREQTQWDLE